MKATIPGQGHLFIPSGFGPERTTDPIETRRRAEEGMAQAEANADPIDKVIAWSCLLRVARRQPTLTADDVWQELHDSGLQIPENGSFLGPLLKRAQKHKVISYLAPVRSQRAPTHGRHIGQWKSHVHTTEAR